MSNIYKTFTGSPLPLGANRKTKGINFSVVSKNAAKIWLVIKYNQIITELELDPLINKTGDIWHIFVECEPEGLLYGYKIEGDADNPHYDSSKILLDPYAKAVNSTIEWGKALDYAQNFTKEPRGLIPSQSFDWEDDSTQIIDKQNLIIYEMHVRSFTNSPTSKTKNAGTFLGIIEKIPYLVELGINAVELMPIQEFNETEYKVNNPDIKETLYQYWGYSTLNFFSPMNRYAKDPKLNSVITEFKTMVKELHKNGIKVILDVVFNHTNEGDDQGITYSFKGIDRSIYYILNQENQLLNYTGCGNTLNTNNPIVQQLILDALRYWVLEMHVDGFRFDLASIFYRDTDGTPMTKAPIIEMMSQDPVLANTLLIAEPWDAAGMYQVGGFYPEKDRWSEWNGRYRDIVRSFIKGSPNLKGAFASSISGSQNIYPYLSPLRSINFVTAHDGFSLYDLVSYNEKHNLANGENNQDGANNNDSWNCGAEGETDTPEIIALRERQIRNFHLALMLSQGIPMILMGDEYAHTKNGNNNTWSHDSELNWFLWDKLEKNQSFHRFYKNMILFRKNEKLLRSTNFLSEEDISWHEIDYSPAQWDKDTQFLAFILKEKGQNKIYAAFNAQNATVEVTIPPIDDDKKWYLVVNTANQSPDDYYSEEKRPLIDKPSFTLAPYSALLLYQK